MMSTHQASEQMLGYLYQVRYALVLLLKNDNENHQISIERFDDVAFSQDDTPKQMIQLKHHVRQQGNLSDASTDMWRTLKVWIDAVSIDESLLAFSNVDEMILKTLLGKVYVVDGANNILDVSFDLHRLIRYSCMPKYEDQICERIEGWWYQRAIKALCSDTPIFYS